jgi:hypothetical protein
MIFLGGVGSPLVVERQWLVTDKITKKWKNVKKEFNIFSDTPVFYPKQNSLKDIVCKLLPLLCRREIMATPSGSTLLTQKAEPPPTHGEKQGVESTAAADTFMR